MRAAFAPGANVNAPIQQHKRVIRLLCAFVIGCILVAGLWPFVTRKNDVAWLGQGNGLRFGEHAFILSSHDFDVVADHKDAPCSLEIVVTPTRSRDNSIILAYSAPEKRMRFAMMQAGDSLFVARDFPDVKHDLGDAQIVVDGVFRAGQMLVISVTSDGQRSSVYLNGVLAGMSPHFNLRRNDLTGTLVLGNSPVTNKSWPGLLQGVAIYDRELTDSEAADNYGQWKSAGGPGASSANSAVAVYQFGERGGNIVHSATGMPGAPELYIPRNYQVLHPVFLQPFWKEYFGDRFYFEDVFVNVVGFIPLGLAFTLYLSLWRTVNRAAVLAVLAGFVLSLTIEVLQGFLARDSSSTDLIMNTLGTGIGALLYDGPGCADLGSKGARVMDRSVATSGKLSSE